MDKEAHWLLSEKYGGKECPEYRADIARLKSGEPLAYIIGWTDFLGCKIDLSKHPLIPRPETEFWTERVIKETSLFTSDNSSLRILDLFAGSGCIGVALLKHLPQVMVDFGERDEELYEQIQMNIIKNEIDPNRARIITSDVFSDIPERYDIIVANPPYIDPLKKSTVQESVLAHEPDSALFADDGGLAFIKELIDEAPQHLNAGSTTYIEFGEKQKAAVEKLSSGNTWTTRFWKDQYDKWRVIKLTLR
jgi:release factor glutamine methyltransferase